MDSRLRRRLERAFADRLQGPVNQRQDTTEIRIGAEGVTDVMRALHDDSEFKFEVLADLAGVDTGTEMWVVYHLWSAQSPDWLRVIVGGLSRDDPRVPSVTFLWNGAEWAEREAYDMFGIIFEGNRDLRRIYMPPDYTSFPLRKDFLLPDDAARSPGEGFRHMEQTHQPAEFLRQPVVRRGKDSLAPNRGPRQ
ncbi:MAG TPA: NADH-quinone oxidoreductase subunit C [Candidatus Limnocylindrales bacterium]|nr:NADH-quinone oxidoreductase subunit C [Candidatus Limnocylindrales bacterium]